MPKKVPKWSTVSSMNFHDKKRERERREEGKKVHEFLKKLAARRIIWRALGGGAEK